MRARYARRIRAGVERARFEVDLAVDLGIRAAAVLEQPLRWTDPDALAQRAYERALTKRVVLSRKPRVHRRTWRPVAA